MPTAETVVRPAGPADVAAILALDRSAPEAPHWAPAGYRAMLGGPPAEQRRSLIVAERAGTVVGFAVGALAGAGEERWGEIESVAVDQGSRRTGVGQLLCQRLMQWARSGGAERMELEVRQASVGAQMLYRRCGFGEVGRRPGYYQDPPDDAVLMIAEL